MGKTLDQTVASVAPPRPTTRAPGNAARTRSGSDTGIQSPERKTRRSAPPVCFPKYPAHCCSAAGAESQNVIGSRRRMRTSRSASRTSSLVASRIEAPAARMPKMS
jgi:hypothetical protein